LSTSLGREFIEYVFWSRWRAIKSLLDGSLSKCEALIELTRATPVMITHGPEGLRGSVKMVGFVPREGLINELLSEVKGLVREGPLRGDELLKFLGKYVYNPEVIDFRYLASLEMAFRHTWANVRATKEAVLLFYTPPATSYEVRCSVRILEEGPYWEWVNLMHRLYHGGSKYYPVYLMRIKEVINKSVGPQGFGSTSYVID